MSKIPRIEGDRRYVMSSNSLKVGIDEKVSIGQSIVLGFQHILAMGVYIMPMMLADILDLNVAEEMLILQMTFIAVGIATVLQNFYGTQLPVMQGPSFVPLSALVTIGLSQGLRVMFGSLIPGAILVSLLGKPFHLMGKFIKKFVEPIIAGITTTVIGISLIPSTIREITFYEGNINNNFIVAILSAAVLIVLTVYGKNISNKRLKFISSTSVVVSLIFGTIIAYFFGMVDTSSISQAQWFSLPKLFPFGTPIFKSGPIITMIIIYLIVSIESTGTWFAVSSVTGKELDSSKFNSGASMDGIGSFISSIFGATPMAGFSSSAGVIAITGVGSRYATVAGGIISILIGLFPKLMSILTIIPSPVIYGVFIVVIVTIFMNGIKLLQSIPLNDRNMIVIGIPIVLSLTPAFLPAEFISTLPEIFQNFVSSGITLGVIPAVLLNIILPKTD